MKISPLSSLDTIPPERKEDTRMGKRSKKKKGYFFKGFSVDTNEIALSSFEEAKAKLRMSNIQILDQNSLTKESLISVLFVWLPRAIEAKGIAWFEREFAPIVEILNPIVAKEKALADALEKQEEARARESEEGFSKPKRREKKNPPGSTGGNTRGH